MAVPDNYYVDLGARFGLDAVTLAELREHQVLYDRSADGELLHVYTPPLDTGFCLELLERRGAYDGYGSANTHVRLAAQDDESHKDGIDGPLRRGRVGRPVGADV